MCNLELVSDDQNACECRVCGPCCTFSWFLKGGWIFNTQGVLKACIKKYPKWVPADKEHKKFQSLVFWFVTSNILVAGHQCFGRTPFQ